MGVGNSKSELEISNEKDPISSPNGKEESFLPDERTLEGETAPSSHRSSDSTDSLTSDEDVANQSEDPVQLSDKIWMFPNKRISNHGEIFEGELRSGTYGTRRIVLKLVPNIKESITEAKIHAKLGNHSHILSIIHSDVCPNDPFGRIYIALDKCHKENLRGFIENRKNQGIQFDSSLASEICRQLIVGMMHIHENKIIHKDIKPENIFLSLNQKTIKIADFGLSQEIDSVSTVLFMKQQFGTDGFRPIESFGRSKISQKSDIFSLGATFYFVLSDGENPFGDDFDILNHNIRNSTFDLSRLLVPNVKTVQHLIKHMIAPKLNDRPTIWQVSEHPCWTGKEVTCDFDYHCEESSESSDSSDEESTIRITGGAQDVFALLERIRLREEAAKLREGGDKVVRNVEAIESFENPQRCVHVTFDRPVKGHASLYKIVAVPESGKISRIVHTQNEYVLFEHLRKGTKYKFEVYASWENVWSEGSTSNFIYTGGDKTEPVMDVRNTKDTTVELSNVQLVEAILAGLVMGKGKDFGQVQNLRVNISGENPDRDSITMGWDTPTFHNKSFDYKVEIYKVEVWLFGDHEQGRHLEYVNHVQNQHDYNRSTRFDLELGETYEFAVSTTYLDIDRDRIFTSSAARLVMCTRPCAPVCIRNDVTDDTLTIEWNAAKGAQSYTLDLYAGNPPQQILHKDVGKDTIYHKKLDEYFGYGTTYYAVIFAFGDRLLSNSCRTTEKTIPKQ